MNPLDLLRRFGAWIGPPIHRVTHFALPPVLLYSGIRIGGDLGTDTRVSCPGAYLPEPWYMVVAVVGLIAGRYLSHLKPGTSYPGGSPPLAAKRAGQAALALGLFLLVIVWFYEAVGVAHVSTHVSATAPVFEPITYYIRCAIYRDKDATTYGYWTISMIFLVTFIVGHWLWADHPDPPAPNLPNAPAARPAA